MSALEAKLALENTPELVHKSALVFRSLKFKFVGNL